ncbi:MAG TPA: hypothetical protein VM324_03125, partial [Egibacteraceae bacterium]|nr:hypothetical protein [Egibacteraceae bacterium]
MGAATEALRAGSTVLDDLGTVVVYLPPPPARGRRVQAEAQRKNPPDERRTCTNAELVAGACEGLDLPEAAIDVDLPGRPAPPAVVEPPPDLAAWEAE